MAVKRCRYGNCKGGRPVWFRLPKKPSGPSLGYGLLYNWYAATDVRGVAPEGWRVPSIDDWDVLITSASNNRDNVISSRDVSDGDPYWINPGNNSLNLGIFASGQRSNNGAYINIRSFFYGTSTSELSPGVALRGAIISNTDFSTNTYSYKAGLSIRCLRDTIPPSPTVTDADGNTYTWVQIGAQYWLAQSLKTTKYNNGDDIPTGLDDTAWAATTAGAWALPNGDPNLPI